MITLAIIISIDFLTGFLINKNADFRISSKPKYIILGHSHPECAYNDSLIQNFQNLAKSSESYYYNFFKLKKVLEQNKEIECVFIEYTNNQIKLEMNNWIWDNKHISNLYPKYSSFMTFKDQYILFKNNPKGFLNAFSSSSRLKLSIVLSGNYDYTNKIGGYNYLERNKTDSLLKKIIAQKKTNSNSKLFQAKDISELNLVYLEKMISLVKKFNKKVILIRTPLHKNYNGFDNEFIYKKILNDRFRDIQYMDLSNFKVENSEFGDLAHLNHYGANKFSIYFDILLEKGVIHKQKKLIKNNIQTK